MPRGASASPRRSKKAPTPSADSDAALRSSAADITDKLSHRNDLHISRKLFHAIGGVCIALLYQRYVDRESLVAVLGSFWLTLLILETLRFKSKWIQALSVKFMGSIMRRNELSQYSGMIYYMPGVAFTLLFFPPLIAKLAILYLALADPLAALVGTLYRTRIPLDVDRIHGKSLLGSIAALLLCLALTVYALSALPLTARVVLASVGAFAAASAELIVETPRPAGVDDNFVIPVFSAFALSAAVTLLSVQLPAVHPL